MANDTATVSIIPTPFLGFVEHIPAFAVAYERVTVGATRGAACEERSGQSREFLVVFFAV